MADSPIRQNLLRADFAALIGPPVTAVIGTVIVLGWSSLMLPPPTIWIDLLLVMVCETLLLQLPFHAIAVRQRWRSSVTYLVGGALAGLITGIVDDRLTYGAIAAMTSYGACMIATYVVLGALNAWLLWLIRRPDRDHTSSAADTFD